MTTLDPDFAAKDAQRDARRARLFSGITKADPILRAIGLGFLTPLMRALAGDNPRGQLGEIWRLALVPILSIAVFLTLWATLAPMVQTSLGAIPGPSAVWAEAQTLHQDAVEKSAREADFYAQLAERNVRLIAEGRADDVRDMAYTGAPSYYDQIWTSIRTVFFGFVLASIVAIPLGILAGLSATANAALNPLIQIFKPVSPLAWLPIVTMVVSATVADESWLPKSFITSAVTVMLCSLWPTLINTALGVASIDKDLVNVSKVLKMGVWTKITKLVLPSALPLIFTGLRLSLGVGWMVLIAAEMLAQNPGLGKFVWDEFQNGSSQSLARIIVAVLTIGIIGFALDRLMYAIQAAFTYSGTR
jgi:nitrate/nitrite transport system permease protein